MGLVPRIRESGKYKGKAMLSKRGNGKIRSLLYFPAINACRFNPNVKAQRDRLTKPKAFAYNRQNVCKKEKRT